MFYQLKNKAWPFRWLIFLCAVIAQICPISDAYAFFGIGEPKVEIKVPSEIEEGGLTPINITASNFNDDLIQELTLSIEGNPESHRQALLLRLSKPQAMVFISTRLRIAKTGVSPITVLIKQVSGKETSRSFPSGHVIKSVDFSKPDTLNVIWKGLGMVVFPKDEIGQPRLRVAKKKDDDSELEFRGILHHPMLPSINGTQALYVNSVEIQYENETVATFETGDALSNDPYVQLNIKDGRAVGKTKMIWRDTRGFSYEKTNQDSKE